MTDLATLQTRLAEAEAAYHKLLIGEKEVSVGYGDKQVSFNRASMADLSAYIAQVKAQIAAAGGPGTPRRPILVSF